MKQIKIEKDNLFYEIKLLHEKVSIIFGKSGVGKTKLLEKIHKIYKKNNKLNKREKDITKTKWFYANDPQLSYFIASNSISNKTIEGIANRPLNHVTEKIINSQLQKLYIEKNFNFRIEAKAVTWYRNEFENNKIQGFELNYISNGVSVPPYNLSDGQKIIAYLAAEIIFFSNEKDIFLMDEPFNKVHHSLRKKIVNWLYTLKPSFIISTHNIDLISQETLLSIKFLESDNGKTKLSNSFRQKDHLNESIYDHMGNIFKKIGGAEIGEAWLPNNALIVEGPSDFIYFMKNKTLRKFLESCNLKIIIAGSKQEISKCVERLIGNSKEIWILFDYDRDDYENEKLLKDIKYKNIYIKKCKSITNKISIISTKEIDGKANNIEELFWNKKVEKDKKGEYAYFKANEIPLNIVETLVIKMWINHGKKISIVNNEIIKPKINLFKDEKIFKSIFKNFE